jgi:hypothetical protein
VIATIHQPSSQIYRVFDRIVLLAGGRALYEGSGGYAPAEYFAAQGSPCAPGYNIADHLLDLAHMPPPTLPLLQQQQDSPSFDKESRAVIIDPTANDRGVALKKLASPTSAAAFLTQLEVLSGREWKVLRRFVLKVHFCSLSLASAFAWLSVVLIGLSLGTGRSSLRISWYRCCSACSSVGCTGRRTTPSRDSSRASDPFSSLCVSPNPRHCLPTD